MNVQIPEVTLNDGLRVPVIGFGTWLVRGAAGVQSMVSAIDMGYRLIDSAYNYENEGGDPPQFGAAGETHYYV